MAQDMKDTEDAQMNRYMVYVDGDSIGEFATIESVRDGLRHWFEERDHTSSDTMEAINDIVPGKWGAVPVEYEYHGKIEKYSDPVLVLDRNSDEWQQFQNELRVVATIADHLKTRLQELATKQIAGSSIERNWFIRSDIKDVVTDLFDFIPKWMSSSITC